LFRLFLLCLLMGCFGLGLGGISLRGRDRELDWFWWVD